VERLIVIGTLTTIVSVGSGDLRSVGVVTLVVVLALSVLIASAGARPSERLVHFATADRNIECVAGTGGLDCVIYSSGYDPGAPDETNYHPHWVLLGRGVGLKGTTRRGLGGSGPLRILRDSQPLRLGYFRCSTRDSHLTCANLRSGHGFFLSQGKQRTF
jgi:hypothetical protein